RSIIGVRLSLSASVIAELLSSFRFFSTFIHDTSMKSSKHSAEKQPELIQRLIRPFQSFAHAEGTSGIVLILCTVVALVWANSPWAASYTELWETHLTIGIGEYALSKSLLHWIDDGLMSVFFFLVGLEIKREVIVGELASFKQ